MKNFSFRSFAFLILAFAFISTTTYAQDAVEGGAGILAISTNGNPNNISTLAVQDWTKGESLLAVDPSNGDVWVYDDSQVAGAKWVLDETSTSVSYDAASNTLNVNGETVAISLADGVNPGLLSNVSDGSNGIDLSLDVTGVISGELNVGELTSSTDVNVADAIPLYDDSAGDEVKVSISDLQTAIDTDDQAISMSSGSSTISLESGGSVNISDRLVYYLDDAAAAAGGVALEQEYKLDVGNQYGLPKGSTRVRVD